MGRVGEVGIVAMVPDLSTWLVKFAGLGGAGLTLN